MQMSCPITFTKEKYLAPRHLSRKHHFHSDETRLLGALNVMPHDISQRREIDAERIYLYAIMVFGPLLYILHPKVSKGSLVRVFRR